MAISSLVKNSKYACWETERKYRYDVVQTVASIVRPVNVYTGDFCRTTQCNELQFNIAHEATNACDFSAILSPRYRRNFRPV